MERSRLRGVALVLAAAMLWGTTGTAQSLAPSGLSPVWVGAWRLALAALFFMMLLALQQPRTLALPALRALPWPAIGGAALCMAVYNLAFFAGVRASSVAIGTAIALGSGPIWAGLLQTLLGGQRPNAPWWAGTTLAIGGGVLMVLGPAATTPVSIEGIGLCLLAGLSYAVYAHLNQHLVTRASPAIVTGAVFTLAAVLALPAAFALAGAAPWPTAGPESGAWHSLLVLAWLGFAATGVAYLCFSHALRHIPAATGVTLALAEPVTAFALAIAVVGERPGWLALAGLLAVLGGLLLVIRAELQTSRGQVA